MATIEGIVNQALDLIGEKRHIGSIQDGSVVARIALNQWGQTRDKLLQDMNPDWARRDLLLTLLKTAPDDYTLIQWSSTYPELPWKFEYQYPTDCIQPLQIKPQQIFLFDWRPRAIPFRLSFGTTVRTILTNEPNAILVYVAQVLSPDNWQNDFIERMIMTLAQKFKAELSDMKQQEKPNANAAG